MPSSSTAGSRLQLRRRRTHSATCLMVDNHRTRSTTRYPDYQPQVPPGGFPAAVDAVVHLKMGLRGIRYRHAGGPIVPLPLTDLFHAACRPGSPSPAGRPDPDRTVFWGSVNPLEGRKGLDLMERQVGDYNARAVPSFSPSATTYGRPYPWRMDDPNIAFHIFERPRTRLTDRTWHRAVRSARSRSSTPRPGHGRGGGQLSRINFVIFPRRACRSSTSLLAAIRYPNL